MCKNELQWAIISQNDPQRGRMNHIDSTMAQNDPKLAPHIKHNEPKWVQKSHSELPWIRISHNEQ